MYGVPPRPSDFLEPLQQSWTHYAPYWGMGHGAQIHQDHAQRVPLNYKSSDALVAEICHCCSVCKYRHHPHFIVHTTSTTPR